MECWSFAFTVLGALASCASVIVAIVIYQRIPDKDVLSHRRNIRRIIKDLKTEMDSDKRNDMLRIIDIDRFDKYYPEVYKQDPVQSYLKGELEGTDIKGIWIVDGLIGVKEQNGIYYVSNEEGCETAERQGLIPYSWIIDIDSKGDEIEPSAIVYSKFNKRYPLSFKKYYRVDSKGRPVIKHGFVKKRSPYQMYSYFLVQKEGQAFKQEIVVKGDSPVYP